MSAARYTKPQVRTALAAQYALGTLQGRARRRFEQLLSSDFAMRTELRKWEQRLASLALKLKPIAPRQIVWANLQHQISVSKTTEMRPLVRRWQNIALLATAASVVLAVALVFNVRAPVPVQRVAIQKITMPTPPTYVAVLQEPKKNPSSWMVTVTPRAGHMKVKVLQQYPTDAKHDVELWVIAGGKPVAIGVVPKSGEGVLAWPKDVPFAEKLVLAVSFEPAGGSTTGAPTGPVLATGEIRQAG